ncbi:MAG: uroporphyrinogen-III synthase [Beutenbergiaceae bacterium]
MSPEALSPVLAGTTMVLTADRRASELATALERRGATVKHAPTLRIRPVTDDQRLAAQTRALIAQPPDTVVVTTGIGFRGWIEAADAHGVADALLASLRNARIVVRGPKARGAVQAAGLVSDWVADSETSAEIEEKLLADPMAGRRIVVQHHGAGADGLDQAFAAAGAQVVSLVVYRWGPSPYPEQVKESVRAAAGGNLDAVVFTSAPGAAAWLHVAAEAGLVDSIAQQVATGPMVAAAVGPVTALPLHQHGIATLQPERGRLGALVRTIVGYYGDVASGCETVRGRLSIRARAAVLDGQVLPLSPTAFSLLRLLAQAEGAVVTRDQLLEGLPGSSTDPHTAEVAVARLRGVVGHELVQTVVKRGYRLVTA